MLIVVIARRASRRGDRNTVIYGALWIATPTSWVRNDSNPVMIIVAKWAIKAKNKLLLSLEPLFDEFMAILEEQVDE